LLRGLSSDELATWTAAMIASGERLDLSSVTRPTTDKHSTGGVGDKITLPLAPIVAACGAAVPQLSGRGLGHTGGTLDKLESIPGWRAFVSNADMMTQLRDVGAVICAAGEALEVAESVEVLAGGGPADVVALTLTLAREMLAACGLDGGLDPADTIADGSAMDCWNRMIRAQGGDPSAPLPRARHQQEVAAPA